MVPEQYRDFADVFSEGAARTLPLHRPYDHTIDILEGETPPHAKIYNMSEVELRVVKDYLNEMLLKGFIRPSSSPAGAPVLFSKKKDGGLRLCVDYRGLNKITKKNRYPLPLIGNLIDQLGRAKIFSKLDLRAGYNNVRIAEGHEWKTAFRTRYGSYEYLVMPFGMTNSPSVFQHFMNDIFHDLLDVYVVIYLDDILIYSENELVHIIHVRTVLERLRQNELHVKPEKCYFHSTSVEYLGVIISPNGVLMDPKKVQIITEWPSPKTIKQLQSFLGFANFYRRFIDNFSGMTKPLTRLLKKDTPWCWDKDCEDVFSLIKTTFTKAPILRYYDPKLPVILECDASDYAIAAIISQIPPPDDDLRPIAFHARTMSPTELNYDIYDKELLAIFEAFKVWRAYLEGAPHTIQVYSDHNNLQYFTTTKQLNRRQARWSEYLSGFDFIINFRAGCLGMKPDALTRRPDVYPKCSQIAERNAENHRALLRPEQLAASFIMNEEALISQIKKAPHDDFFNLHFTEAKKSDHPLYSLSPDETLLLCRSKIYVPDYEDLRLQVLMYNHDHRLIGHPGIKKTILLISKTYFWPRLRKDVTRYVRSCNNCRRAKTPRHAPYGKLKPLPIGERPWSSISMDYIEELPPSRGYDAILVVVCRLTKQVVFIPAHTTDKSTDLAQSFITNVFSKHGLPADIISDRGKLFVSKFWSSLCEALDIQSNLSTAYHPQTDGQTERINQSLEQYLRFYVNYQQDDWVDLLPIAEFVYNNTPHTATGVTPFFANKGYHPRMTVSLEDIPSHEAHLVAVDLQDLHAYLREQIKIANEDAAKFADRHRGPTPDWEIDQNVWLDLRNVKTKRPAKKLDHRRYGPLRILKKVSSHAYKVELPKTLTGIHNVFHVNLLELDAQDPYPRPKVDPPPPIEVDGEDEWEVSEILDSRKR